MSKVTLNHFHFCVGLGGAALGFSQANPRVGALEGRWKCIGGIDVSPAAIRDFEQRTGATGTVMDLFTRDQYKRFHGQEPPADWKEATPADIRRAAGNQRPHAVFISSPCKGASGLLSEAKAKTPKYQALNELTLRCVWLMGEAWADDPVDLIIFENVPRLASRGRHLLDQISSLLGQFGYAVAETTHDCGEIGGLAQSRKRLLLVARHTEKVPAMLYEPETKRLKPVGDVLGRMTLPGDPSSGPMHRIPRLQWKTWVRLAFVEAGKDWRSLQRLAVQDGQLRDYLIVPETSRADFLGVIGWDEHSGAVSGRAGPTNGRYSVADPRPSGMAEYSQYGIVEWDQSAGAVTAQSAPGGGRFSVADPRGQGFASKYQVTPFDGATGTVIAGSTTGQGAFAVADPRPGLSRKKGDNYLSGGHYGVVDWDSSVGAVSASACYDNGNWSVADPRLPAERENCVAIIRALDGTWHRPFTTLELAALQSLIEPEEYLELDGLSDEAWRERIGNAVPPAAAKAVAEVMGTTLLLAMTGETFVLSSTPVWVRNVAIAISMARTVPSDIVRGVYG